MEDGQPAKARAPLVLGVFVGTARIIGRSPLVAPILRAGERRAVAAGGEMLERVADSDAVDRAVVRVLESEKLERMVSEALESRHVHEIADRVLASPELERAIERVVASPAVRAGLTQQTVSFGDELRGSLRQRARALDERLTRRPGAGYGGVASRAVALAVDLGIAFALVTLAGGFLAFVSSLVGELRPAWLAGLLVAFGCTVLTGAYFVFFWTVTGQTPGMRLMALRVSRGGGDRIGAARALVRYVGLLAAIVPFFAGFLPALFDARRRALPDFLAGTVVVDGERGLPRGDRA